MISTHWILHRYHVEMNVVRLHWCVRVYIIHRNAFLLLDDVCVCVCIAFSWIITIVNVIGCTSIIIVSIVTLQIFFYSTCFVHFLHSKSAKSSFGWQFQNSCRLRYGNLLYVRRLYVRIYEKKRRRRKIHTQINKKKRHVVTN